jgi:uncharacterized protein YbjT (DUF2867 family)
VIGGTGLIGSKLARILRDRGHEVLAVSPASGVDSLTAEGLDAALAGAQVVVDVTNSPSVEDAAAMTFFETSSRNLMAAETEAGIRHHVVLSVVGTDRLQESGYFQGKLAQEQITRASGIPYTILRSTQFFEFMSRIADVFSDGKTIRIVPALVQPIAADDVVAALADIALGPPANSTIEVAGPQKLRLDQLVRLVLGTRNDPRRVTVDFFARYFGAEINDRSLVPGSNARIAATRFDTWLTRMTSLPEPA